MPRFAHWYKEGVITPDGMYKLSQKLAQKLKGNVSDKTLSSYGISWESLNHAVTIIGWGQNENIKYWIVRNSYGPDWGNKGDFLIQRGVNAFGIEGENTAAIPILCSET